MLGAGVERGEDLGLGDADEIGAVDDVVLQARESATACGGFRLVRHEIDEFGDHFPRGLRIVAGNRIESLCAQPFDRAKAGNSQHLADEDDEERQSGERRQPGGQPAQPFGAAEKLTDELIGPKPDRQRDERTEGGHEDGGEPASGASARWAAAEPRR